MILVQCIIRDDKPVYQYLLTSYFWRVTSYNLTIVLLQSNHPQLSVWVRNCLNLFGKVVSDLGQVYNVLNRVKHVCLLCSLNIGTQFWDSLYTLMQTTYTFLYVYTSAMLSFMAHRIIIVRWKIYPGTQVTKGIIIVHHKQHSMRMRTFNLHYSVGFVIGFKV